MSRIPPQGWHVVVTHPTTGRHLVPDVIDEDVAVLPSLNSLPEVRIAIRKNKAWLDPALEESPKMDVYLDGEKQPIDELREVEDKTSHTVLHGVGGTELRERVQAEYFTERRHVAARNLITNQTTYAEDVDTPVTDSITGREVQDSPTDEQFSTIIPVGDTDPIDTSNSEVSTRQTCFTQEGENGNSGDAGAPDTYSGGNAARLDDIASSASWTFTPTYDIPSEHVGIAVRDDSRSDSLGIEWTFNNEVIDSLHAGVGINLGWYEVGDGDYSGGSGYTGSDLEAGTAYTLQVDVTDAGSGDNYIIDVVAPYDKRFNYTFDNDNGGSGGYLDGPELYPVLDVPGIDYETAFSMASGAFTVVMDDTTGNQRIQVSNDRGSTWLPSDGTENNTTSIDESFSATGATLRARVTLDRHSPQGARSQTPRFGYESQTITDWNLQADIDLELLLVDQDYDNDLASILSSIAGEEFLWSYNLDANSDPQVSLTQPGQRTAARNPDIGDISIRKDLDVWESVTVKGSNRTISGETFDSSTSFVPLNRENLITGSETVFDSNGVNYERVEDYEMDYSKGEVKALSGGDLVSGDTYNIEYEIEVSGNYTVDGAGSNPREFVETVPAVNSTRGAEQIAYVLASDFAEPRYAGTLDIPRSDVGFDPLEALTLTNLDLPDAATPLEVRGKPEITPTGVRVRLGSRGKLEQSLRQIAEQVRAVSQQT